MNRRYWSLLSVLILFASLTLPGSAVAATSYAGLRAQSGSVGQTTSLVAPRIGGEFVFSATDPNGYGDDGGIVIKAPNGWWVRKFAHTLADPVKLDWFEVVEGQNVTTILGQLGFTYKPKLYVQAPTVPMTLQMDPVDFKAIGITNFALLESDAKVSIQQTGDRPVLFYFENMKELVFGTDRQKASRDEYNLTLVGTWTWTNRDTVEGSALVHIMNQDTSAPPFYFRFNTRYPKQASIRMDGASGPEVAHVSGRFEGGGMTFGHLRGEIRFEDALVSDPLGYAHGWTGDTAGTVDKALSDVRVLGVTTVYSKKVTGSLELRYGGAHFGSFFVDQLGNGASEPFVIHSNDYGYTGPNALGFAEGVMLKNPWFMTFGVKFDGMGVDEPSLRNIKLVQKDQYGRGASLRKVFLEASQVDDNANGSEAVNSYTTWTLVDIDGLMATNGVGAHPDDRTHHMIYQGDGVNPAHRNGLLQLMLHDTARNGMFHNISIEPFGYDYWQYDRHPKYEDGSHNTVLDALLTGKLYVKYKKPPANGNRATNVTFLGLAREVINVAAGASLEATNICAPAGSTIGGGGNVTVNGRSVALPYVLQASDCSYEISGFGAYPGSTGLSGPSPDPQNSLNTDLARPSPERQTSSPGIGSARDNDLNRDGKVPDREEFRKPMPKEASGVRELNPRSSWGW
jgi:hypothetical protein